MRMNIKYKNLLDGISKWIIEKLSIYRGTYSTFSSVPSTYTGYPEDKYGNKKPTDNDYIIIKDASDYSFIIYKTIGYITNYVFTNSDINATIPEGIPQQTEIKIILNKPDTSLSFENIHHIEINEHNHNIISFDLIGTYYRFLIFGDESVSYFIDENSYSAIKQGFNTYPISGEYKFVYSGSWDIYGKLGWKPLYSLETYNDSISAFKARQRYNDYLYGITYNSIDYESAKDHYASLNEPVSGGCSMIRKGNLYGRNYDWTINKQVEFVVTTKALNDKFSVTGIATCAGITTDNVHTYSDEYKYLPFRILDGINEKGLVCSVNQLPYNEDLHISANGTIPVYTERESINMIMLVRYILDKFENPLEAADYIKNYVSVKPIIGEDGNVMDFHFAIADKNVTVYLYFEGTETKYEIKQAGESLVMTNFRLASTQLVDGHYSRTDSNIELFGQGVERANSLLGYSEGNLLSFLRNVVNFTKAYTTPDKLSEFTGIDGATITDTDKLIEIQSDAAELYGQEYTDGTLRTDADLWQTVHSIVYDFSDKTMKIMIQEIEGDNTVYTFNPYPRVEIDVTIDTIVPTTTNFVVGTAYSIHNAFQRTANLFAGYWNYIKTNITDLIPLQANADNQLADKNFVNETVAQNAANFRGNWSKWSDVPTDGDLYPEDYAGNKKPTNNDYMVVQDASDYGIIKTVTLNGSMNAKQSEGIYLLSLYGSTNVDWPIVLGETTDIVYEGVKLGTVEFGEHSESFYQYDVKFTSAIDCKLNYQDKHEGDSIYIPYQSAPIGYSMSVDVKEDDYSGSWRFLYVGDWDTEGINGWQPAYRIGSAFTDAQQAAIDSGITADKVDTYDAYDERIDAVETDKVDKIYTASKIYGTDANGAQIGYTAGANITLDNGTINAASYDDSEVKGMIEDIAEDVEAIQAVIPAEASEENQLADKNFVETRIAENVVGSYRGNWSDWSNVPDNSDLYPADYSGSRVPVNNDYMVMTDASNAPAGYDDNYTIEYTAERYMYITHNGVRTRCDKQGGSARRGELDDIYWKYTGTVYFYCKKYCLFNGNLKSPNSLLVSYNWSDVQPTFYIYAQRDANYNGSWRFHYQGVWETDGRNGWSIEYLIEKPELTTEQQIALNSGITPEMVEFIRGLMQS